uniref:CMP/dCMP-type deaminase domain-containing protein n=1 Tax=Helicotheca tamesis TaxID=374047 RepID=A0A7S2N365_9STRA
MNNNKMFSGLLVGNNFVSIGESSPAAGARLRGGFANSSCLQSISRHAEMDSLRWTRTHYVRKAHLVVVRWKSDGTFGNSRPCLHCIKRIIQYHSNVNSVTFFEEGGWFTQRPEVCVLFSQLSSAEQIRMGRVTANKF